MAVTILAWIYITFICWSWGDLTISLLKGNAIQKDHFSVPIVCMAGLSVITVICGYLSLFLALGNVIPHLLLTSVALLHTGFRLKTSVLRNTVQETFSKL